MMPGIFAATLLQYYDEQLESSVGPSMYLYDSFREAQRAGDIDKDETLEFVKRSYCVTPGQAPRGGGSDSRSHERKVERSLRTSWERCMSDTRRTATRMDR